MDTSVGARTAALALIFAGSCAVLYGNARIAYKLLLGRRVSRWARRVWPPLGLILALCIVDAFCVEPHWIQVTRHEITTPKLQPGSRVRIAHLTDLHIERLGDREMRMLNLTARERPDIIVLTGDYSIVKNSETRSGLEQIARRLSAIAPCYAVDGNWDIAQDLRALERGGVRVLDRWTVVEPKEGVGIALGRIPWLGGMTEPPPEAKPLFRVLLTHLPGHFDEAARRGVDLTLAGHTHGGQLRLPVFGALMPDRRLVGRYQAGMYESGGRRLYVSRGIGLEGGAAPRVRFWCRPEIAVIDIVGDGTK